MKLSMGQKAFTFFKGYISLLKVINDELTLQVDDTGITVMGMDPSHVAMIDSKLKAELFDEFSAPDDGTKITLNLGEFSKFLDRIGKDETVKIDYDADKAKVFIATRTSGRNRRFSLSVLEPLEEEIPKPKIFFKSSARILTQSVERAIKDAGLVSEWIRMAVEGETLKLDARGDMGSASNEFTKDSDEILELKSEEDSSAAYTLSYLADIFGQIKGIADVVTLELATDMPVKIQVEPNNTNLEVTLYLAPMIGV